MRQSRRTELTEIRLRPPKKRNSTVRVWRGSSFSSGQRVIKRYQIGIVTSAYGGSLGERYAQGLSAAFRRLLLAHELNM
jgi:hypothetical protein